MKAANEEDKEELVTVSSSSELWKPLRTHETSFQPSDVTLTLNIAIDRTDDIELLDGSGRTESRSCNLIVLDNFFEEKQRLELLNFITAPNWDHKQGHPPPQNWERLTSDGLNLPKTWGVKEDILKALSLGQPPAIVEIGSRLAKLYPNYHVAPQPSNTCFVEPSTTACSTPQQPWEQPSCEEFVCNAAVHGDCFRWHVDADPDSFPSTSPWVQRYDHYVNHEPGKPLFITLLLYLDKFWPRNFDAETLFLDDETETGVFVRPKAYRAILMDQDMYHRLSAPSLKAQRPRYSLVWKLLLIPKSAQERATLVRPDWPAPNLYGSAAKTRAPNPTLSSSSSATHSFPSTIYPFHSHAETIPTNSNHNTTSSSSSSSSITTETNSRTISTREMRQILLSARDTKLIPVGPSESIMKTSLAPEKPSSSTAKLSDIILPFEKKDISENIYNNRRNPTVSRDSDHARGNELTDTKNSTSCSSKIVSDSHTSSLSGAKRTQQDDRTQRTKKTKLQVL